MNRRGISLTSLPLVLAVCCCIAFVVAPLAMMLWDVIDAPDGLTLEPFANMFGGEIERRQMRYSLELGLAATTIAGLIGFGHAWLTCRTDLPGQSWLGPLGIAPLVVPPIFVAMGFADVADVAGFWSCAMLLGISYAPFVAVMTARGMRSIDGRVYEAALCARGSRRAELMLARMCLPEIAAGCLLAFVFVVSEHGVPEFLTVKGKTWHTYAEGVFAKWTRRATGTSHEDFAAPIVAAIPLVIVVLIALAVALRLRARSALTGDFRPLPTRRLGRWRWPSLTLPLGFLGAGVVLPIVVLARWAAGSTDLTAPMSFAVLRQSFRSAWTEASGDLGYTLAIGGATAALTIAIALPLARAAARRAGSIDFWSALPLAVPAVVLSIGFTHVYNTNFAGEVYDTIGVDFYDSAGVVVAAYAARFLPFGVLTLSSMMRRIPRQLEEAAELTGRGPFARAARIHAPMVLPAAWSALCLVFVLAVRELDVAVVLPAGNGTVVRRLSNVVHFGGEDVGGALALLLLLATIAIPALISVLVGRRLTSLS